jgi:hypothetical protein
MTPTSIIIKPVDKTNWPDFESFFESKGAPKYCWCMAWRMTTEELKENHSERRKTFMYQRVSDNVPVGLLAYHQEVAIAWCSVAPRETHQRLGGDDTKEKVWSLTCFFIKKEFRDKGLVKTMIDEAKKYAKKNGAKFLEAYPVLPDSPSYRFMGFVPTFEQTGFEFVKKAGSRRHVMVCKL